MESAFFVTDPTLRLQVFSLLRIPAETFDQSITEYIAFPGIYSQPRYLINTAAILAPNLARSD